MKPDDLLARLQRIRDLVRTDEIPLAYIDTQVEDLIDELSAETTRVITFSDGYWVLHNPPC